MTYTQRDWDRTVGWGKVPKEYKKETILEDYKKRIDYDMWTDKRAQKIMDNETSTLYSEHYGVDEYIDRYAHVFKDESNWRVDMYDKNDLSTYKIKYYEEETNADSAAENWCLGYNE